VARSAPSGHGTPLFLLPASGSFTAGTSNLSETMPISTSPSCITPGFGRPLLVGFLFRKASRVIAICSAYEPGLTSGSQYINSTNSSVCFMSSRTSSGNGCDGGSRRSYLLNLISALIATEKGLSSAPGWRTGPENDGNGAQVRSPGDSRNRRSGDGTYVL